MADFATLAELETWMATSGLGPRGTAVLAAASAKIRAHCGQDLDEVAGRQEAHAGDQGRRILNLTQTPVTAVSEVTVDAVVITDFIWNRWGQIYMEDYSEWEGAIVVTYDSGYGVTEDEWLAAHFVCLDVAARALGGQQETFGTEIPELRGAPPGIVLTTAEEAALDKHMLVGVG
jgi:hypothetical protein